MVEGSGSSVKYVVMDSFFSLRLVWRTFSSQGLGVCTMLLKTVWCSTSDRWENSI